jgi:hypothetical protein
VTLVVEHRTSKGLDTFQLRSPDDQRSVFPVKKIVPRDAREMVATVSITKVLPTHSLLDRTVTKHACSLANHASEELFRMHEVDNIATSESAIAIGCVCVVAADGQLRPSRLQEGRRPI